MGKAFGAISFCLLFSHLAAGIGYGSSAGVITDTAAPSLTILAPAAGETCYVGSTYDILWSAADLNLLPGGVNIWYSLDGGSSYLPLVEGTLNDGSHTWSVPFTPTENARVRVRVADAFGNFTRLNSPAFIISYIPPAEPQNLRVDISNGWDAVLTWDAVTHTVPPFNQQLTPDGYIVLYSEIPDAADQFYYFLGETDQLEFTHWRVARFRDQMFYRVIAYLDPAGRMKDVLTALRKRETSSLQDLKAALQNTREAGK